MKILMKLIILFAIILAYPASWSYAANFRVVALSQVDGISYLDYVTDEGVESVPVSKSGFSKSYSIPESGLINFYNELPDDLPEELPLPLFSVNFPESTKDVILLLQAVPNTRKYTYIVIEDSVEAFPKGSVLVMNFTRKSVYAKFGEERVKVESGERQVVPLAKQMDMPFNSGVKFAAEFDGYGKVFSSSSWYLLSTMKIFCIIFPDENGNPQIRRIRLT